MIEFITPGPLASVQDLGRHGYRNIGVGTSGAMDGRALRIVNLLVGNDQGAAGVEFTFGDFEFVASEDVDIAIGGADASVSIDGQPVPSWWAQTLRQGQHVSAGVSASGMRIYLALGGGIDVPEIMGARATELKGGFGGLEGRMLRPGDRLRALVPRQGAAISGFGLSNRAHPELFAEDGADTELRFVPAAEWADYDEHNRQLFLQSRWTVSFDSNRIGSRLEGPQIVPRHRRELLSHGILPGTIQLPPSGQPVIQLQEGNTCGGYPKLGAVIAADLSRFAQVPLGESIRFKVCTPADARAANALEQERIRTIAHQADLARGRASSAS